MSSAGATGLGIRRFDLVDCSACHEYGHFRLREERVDDASTGNFGIGEALAAALVEE